MHKKCWCGLLLEIVIKAACHWLSYIQFLFLKVKV
jgi:hypothetical protein